MSGVNEMSDGDIDLELTNEEEDIDFDCGWNSVLFTFNEIKDGREGMVPVDDTITDDYSSYLYSDESNNMMAHDYVDVDIKNNLLRKDVRLSGGDNKYHKRRLQQGGGRHNGPFQPNSNGKETLKYTSNELCDTLDEFDSDWCKDMQSTGIVWLVFGILAILFSLSAIIAIWKMKSKGSKLYLVLQSIGIICILIGTINWLSSERCEEFEDVETPDDVTMEVSIGASITLMFVATGFGTLAVLMSIFYVCKTNQAELNFDYNWDLKQKAGLTVDDGNNNNSGNDVGMNEVNGNEHGNNGDEHDDNVDENDPNVVKVAQMPPTKTKGQFESVPGDEVDQA